MPFGLTNAFVVFKHLMNDVFVSIWIILWFITLMTSSFSQRTWRTMNTHVCLVLEKLQEVGLYAKLEKCEFHQSKVEFLGYTISRNDICMDLTRFKLLLIALLQFLFEMSNVFLDLSILIDISLPTIRQWWPSYLVE
jgi:hypothetical protein